MVNYTHAAIIPLIGGFPIATSNILGYPPSAIFSYSPFENNDKLYLSYLAEHGFFPPYFQIDKMEKENKIRDVQHLVGKIDIVNGTPPCSGLSMAGNLGKGKRAISPVNDWMINAADFIMGVIRPKIYVFENAPNLSAPSGDLVRENLMEKARYHGYAATFYKTDTLLHGIPQRRPRTYAVFMKGKNAPVLEYYQKESPNVADYLGMIPKDATLQDEYTVPEPYIDDFEIVKFVKMKFGEDWRKPFLETRDHLTSYDFLNRNGLLEEYRDYVYNLPEAHETSKRDIDHVIKKLSMGKNFRLSHRVLCVDKHHIYAVVGEMMERNVHPTEDRRMNIREYLWMMGMPHDFQIRDPKDYGKIPQNCPVRTNEDIIREVVAILGGERKMSSHRFEMQDNTKYTGVKSKQLF